MTVTIDGGREPARARLLRWLPRSCVTLTLGAAFALVATAPSAAAQTTADPPATAVEDPVPDDAPAELVTIVADDLMRHARYLASDELAGRYTGSPGQVAAARYIAEHFESLGLEPLGDRRARGLDEFFQSWRARCVRLAPKGTEIRFGDTELTSGGFAVVPGDELRRTKLRGRFLYCGDGAPADMPEGMARALPVVRLGGLPDLPRQGMNARRLLLRARDVCKEASRKGARAVVFTLDDDAGLLDTLNYSALLPGKPMLQYAGQGRIATFSIPAVFLAPAHSRALLEAMAITDDDEPRPTRAKGSIGLNIVDDERFECVNVCALLEGSDTRGKAEAVVFSAHMDHMGMRIDGDAFNGADDNASGTSALLEIAEAFAAGEPPARSVIFLAVSGEELGLWGSRHWAENPTWDIERVVADINIDMIGRVASLSGERGISATPSPGHEQFNTLVQTAAACAEALGIALSSGDEYYARSDHYNFAQKGVPVVFFCDGEHDDYHRVSDEADRLNAGKMQRVARLAYWTGHLVAEAETRPVRVGASNGWLADD